MTHTPGQSFRDKWLRGDTDKPIKRKKVNMNIEDYENTKETNKKEN